MKLVCVEVSAQIQPINPKSTLHILTHIWRPPAIKSNFFERMLLQKSHAFSKSNLLIWPY